MFWAGLFVYLLWLQARLRAVSRELRQLEERLAERAGAPASRVEAQPARQVTLRDVAPQRTTE